MSIEIRKPAEIVAHYNAITKSLISRLEKKSRRADEIANLDRLKKRISLLKTTIADNAVLVASAPFFIDYSEQILSRNEDFFNKMDVEAECLLRTGQQDEFISALTDTIRGHYNKATQEEKDEVYNKVKTMFECVVEYNIAINS